LTDTS